jgi:anaerobic magnesium-protoporphyrin IX monomethyl ester cyclase
MPLNHAIRKETFGQPRVLLIYPAVRLAAPPRVPPMGYLYMGAVLEEAGIAVEILDQNVERLPVEELLEKISTKEFDVIGIGGMTTVYYYIKLLSLKLKEKYPDLPIIGGGSACSASPDVVLGCTGVDVVCIGEAEPIIEELVRCLVERRPIGHIEGIAFRSANDRIAKTLPRSRFEGWSGMSFPAHHLVDMEVYIRNNALKYNEVPGLNAWVSERGIDVQKASRPVHIFSKRGCPFGCTFCYRNFGRKVVYDSPEHVLAYMEYLEERYDTVHFVFGDELFNVDQHWVTEFCELIAKSGHNYLLGTSNGLRANCLKEENVIQMKSVGFYRVGIGIESFHDPSLMAMKKNQTARQIIDAIKLLKKHGLHIGEGGMLFGYPTDDWEAMRSNVRALTELGYFNTGFSIPCPYPGTYLFDEAKKKGLIEDDEGWLMELADKDVANRVINLSGRSIEELTRIINWGVDQLSINSVAGRWPMVARILTHLQPIARKHFDVSLVDMIYNLKRGRNPFKSQAAPAVDIKFNLDGLNIVNNKGLDGLSGRLDLGDRHILVEALNLLRDIKRTHRPLPFLTEAAASSVPASPRALPIVIEQTV